MCLGENIRYLRIKKGFSQDDIAEKLGYKSYTTIQKWESGVSEPPVKKLKELSTLLDADMDDLNNKKLYLGETSESEPSYYLDDETAELADFMFKNPEYKVLFDASRKVKPEDIKFVKEMIERLSDK